MRDSESEIEKRIQSLFDPGNFAHAATVAVAEIQKYFEKASSEPRVRQWTDPKKLFAQALGELKSGAGEGLSFDARIKSLAQLCLDHSHNLHSPRYMGHQVPPPLPLAGVFDFIGAAANQAPGLYEMGPLSAVAEKSVIYEMAKLIGWENTDFGAVGTSGGSLANLTAILAARNHRYKDVWAKGLAQVQGSRGKPAIAVGADSHYSVMRSAGILGLGTHQIVKIPLDSRRRMDPAKLKVILENSEKEGLDIFCIVATACSTPIGAFDPLEEIAAVANDKNIWLHVDGAHGASVIFSARHRSLVKGLEKADSITWDAHKMMYVPALSTFVFYKKRQARDGAFQQDAPYLNDPSKVEAQEFDTFGATLECTKRPLALGLWALWAVHGPSIFEDCVDVTFSHAQQFYNLLKQSPDFAPLHAPQANILCFRYLPEALKKASPEKISEFQKSIREKLIRAGEYYITATKIDGLDCLRVTLINPMSRSEHFEGLLQHVRHLGAEILN